MQPSDDIAVGEGVRVRLHERVERSVQLLHEIAVVAHGRSSVVDRRTKGARLPSAATW